MPRRRRTRIAEAEKFVLKDEFGQDRAALEMGNNGPVFCLLTDQGHPRLTLDVGDYGPSIKFTEPHTETMIELCAPHTGFEVSWAYRHRGVRAKVKVEMSPDGVTFYDGQHRVLCRVEGTRFEPPAYLRDRE